jgi:2-methylcitrate dehydratase
MGFTEEQALTAISHVFMDGSPLRTFRNAPNTVPRKGWAAGDACSRALQLIFLVSKGQPGARTVLTVPRWGFYANLFGGKSFDLPCSYGTWVMENIFFKCIPAEGHGISAIDATLQQAKILQKRALDPLASITKIRLRTHAACIRIISKQGALHNTADRDHCVQYMIAVTLLKGQPLEVDDYADASHWANNAAVDALRDRIEVFEDAALTRDYLDPKVKTAASGVSIQLRNGELLDEILVHYPIGHVEHPHTTQAVNEKFWRNMSLRFSKPEIEHILEAIQDEDMRVCDWVDLWVRSDIPQVVAESRL